MGLGLVGSVGALIVLFVFAGIFALSRVFTPNQPSPTVTDAALSTTDPAAMVEPTTQREIGCATTDVINGLMVEENFEGGKMFWREPIDYAQVPVLFNEGTWRIFEHAPYVEGSPEFPCADVNTSAQCPPTPRRGFGMMWCNIPEIRSDLGSAIDCERGYQSVSSSAGLCSGPTTASSTSATAAGDGNADSRSLPMQIRRDHVVSVNRNKRDLTPQPL
jgi:hypothetical protein